MAPLRHFFWACGLQRRRGRGGPGNFVRRHCCHIRSEPDAGLVLRPAFAVANFLSRSAIHLIAGPGQTVSDTAVLTNYSTQTLNFDVYGSDAYNTKRLGVFTLNPPNVKPTDVGSWVDLPVNQYNLPPKTATEFHFEVKVPINASPGDHAGGIVALNLAPNTNPESGTQVAVQRGEGIAIYVRVPGPCTPAWQRPTWAQPIRVRHSGSARAGHKSTIKSSTRATRS